ncbi:3-hydroxyacyl-CoA dehydrogenase NAD-binding domain-containing protein [Salinimicrobium xinjiangense]|uniref:3-hydroxyacyl-CoA dehydrogenase NAD-binding domain-containing protein n=1 Tax=Salinimicrobium xinjiangense TaxID=438596 RepID=UPI0004104822|nr:3-hydroxyacyl-CoA dehydrogenase NAD-binding domain-containing protein [Salinimicrobium xinjiangense]
MAINKVTVLGTGSFGARIAFHIAYNKVDVTVYDQDYGLLEEARTKFREFCGYYQKHFNASPEDTEAALANIAYSMEIEEATGNADLIIEAIAEDLKAKKELYYILRKTGPDNAFFATTSQGLDPELLAKASGRPEKFLSLHFSGNKDQNIIEIIGFPQTQKKVLDAVANFSEGIGLLPTIKKVEPQN